MVQFGNYTIRILTENDLEVYFQLVERNRHRLEEYFTGTVSKTKTLEDTRRLLQEHDIKVKEKSYFPFIIVEAETNKIVGFIDIKNIDRIVLKAELGFYADAEFAGKGVMSKAFETFCKFCFKEFGFQKLFLRTHESNKAARRLAEKNGFEIEGTLRQDYRTSSGKLVDLLYFGKLAT